MVLSYQSKEQYITSYQEIVGNKICVYYHLEEEGKEYLKTELENYYNLVKALDQLFKGEKTEE